MNLCAGATLGVVYGAASLWQWRIDAMSRILAGIDLRGMVHDTTHPVGWSAVFRPGCLVVYAFDGGWVRASRHDEVPPRYRVFDAMTSQVTGTGTMVVENGRALPVEFGDGPRVVIFIDDW